MAINGFDTNYFVDALFAYAQEEFSEWATGKTTADLEELLQNVYPDAEDIDAAAELFYADYGMNWGIAPNGFFNAAEYRLAFAEKQVETNHAFSVTQALAAYDAELAGEEYNGDAYAHYLAEGAAAGVNPSNDFDESEYIQSWIDGADLDMEVAEVRQILTDAGLTALDFFVDYPEYKVEYPAIAVTGDELVDAGTPTGTVFTLTNGVDIKTANVFDAPRVWNPDDSDQMNSLNDDDQLTGEGADPTLNFTFVNDTETGDYSIMPKLDGIETINVAFTADFDQTLDLQDATGVKAINASRIDNTATPNAAAGPAANALMDVTLDNIQAALTDLSISDSNSPTANVNVLFVDKALRSTADALNLKLDNAQVATLVIEEELAGDQGYETINLESTGAANAVAVMAAEDIKSLIITGDENLTIGSLNEPGSLTTVDASALAASLDYTVDAGVMGATPDGASNGNVAFTLTGTVNSDTVRISDQVGTNDVLAAGDNEAGGDIDTLVMSNANSVNVANGFLANSTTAQATGFEAAQIIRLDDGVNAPLAPTELQVDLDQMSGDQTITLLNQESGDGNLTYNLENATSAEATGITILHSGNAALANPAPGDNGVTQNVIDLDVAAGVTAAGVAIATGTNSQPKFNFTFTADSDAGTGETDVVATNTVASITITDSDNESNSVRLTEFAAHTGTITVAAGQANTFMNLDSTGSDLVGGVVTGFGINQTGIDGSALWAAAATADSVFAAKYAGTGYADITGAGAGYIYGAPAAGAERIVASTINAAAFAGDLIVRVGEKNQTITTGTGNDTVIFDAVKTTDSSRLTAGLNISDKVAMGTGVDTIIIDGDVLATETIGLADTEWTNLSGVDAIRLGNAGLGTYRLSLSNSLIDQTDAGDRITIINSDGNLATAAGSDATINMRALNNANFVDFYGANGNGILESVNTIQVNEVTMSGNSTLNGGDNNVGQAYTAAAMNLLFPALLNKATTLDANTAWALLDGQFGDISTAAGRAAAEAAALVTINAANAVTPGSAALTAVQLAALTPDGNNNVLEIYNNAEITVGDLANVSNFSTIEFRNDQNNNQLLNITLTDSIVDALVDASHTATTAQSETLSIQGIDNISAGTVSSINLQADTLTANSDIDILLGRGQDVIKTGAGDDVVVMAGNYITGQYGIDAITGFDMDAVANWAKDADYDNDGIVDAGADTILGTADDGADAVLTQLVVTDTIALGAGNDTLITYGAINLAGATLSDVNAMISHSNITMTATQFAALGSLSFEGDQSHTLTIVDNIAGANSIDFTKIILNDGSLTVNASTESNATGGNVNNQSVSGVAQDKSANGDVNVDAPMAPVAGNDLLVFSTPSNIAHTITANEVNTLLLANDTDANGNTLFITDVLNSGATDDGIAVLNADGSITFTPTAGFHGVATFDYVVSDGTLTDIGSVTATITEVTSTYALTGSATVNEGASASYALATTNVADGTVVNYTITGVEAADITDANLDGDNNPLTGRVTVNSNAATFNVALAADHLLEGAQTMVVTVNGSSVSTTVADTSVPVTATPVDFNEATGTYVATDAAEDITVNMAAWTQTLTLTGFDIAEDRLIIDTNGQYTTAAAYIAANPTGESGTWGFPVAGDAVLFNPEFQQLTLASIVNLVGAPTLADAEAAGWIDFI